MSEVYGYTPEEARAVLASKAFRHFRDPAAARCILALQLATGGRVHEVLALRCADVFEKGMCVKSRVWYKKTKNGERRAIELPTGVVPYLAAWGGVLARRGMLLRALPIFTRENGKTISRFTVYRMYQAANRELGLKHRGTHSARKAWAMAQYEYWTQRRNSGDPVDPLVMVQKLGGWKDVNSCARYIGIHRFDSIDGQRHIDDVFFAAQNLTS